MTAPAWLFGIEMLLVGLELRGDSGIGSFTNSFRVVFGTSSPAVVDIDSVSMSVLIGLLKGLVDSWLGFRRRPMRPSFSWMATKLVRTVDSGLGDSEALPETKGTVDQLSGRLEGKQGCQEQTVE